MNILSSLLYKVTETDVFVQKKFTRPFKYLNLQPKNVGLENPAVRIYDKPILTNWISVLSFVVLKIISTKLHVFDTPINLY